jgi:hypothetical protein
LRVVEWLEWSLWVLGRVGGGAFVFRGMDVNGKEASVVLVERDIEEISK